MTTFQWILFGAYNLLILGTCAFAVYTNYRQSQREPSSKWAANLRESIASELEAFEARMMGIQATVKRASDDVGMIDEREKRHFASLNTKLNQLLASEPDDDDDDDPVQEIVRQHQLMQAIQRMQRPGAFDRPATGTDIPVQQERPIPGLIQNENANGSPGSSNQQPG